ncbi:MAG: hypothetical protein ACREMB_13105, partial [Candidatus Rokuibacteriota bacterium]
MKRLLVVLVALTIVPLAGAVAMAQQPDPLHIGVNQDATPAALEGGYRTDGGRLQFVVLGSPRDCNDGSDPVSCPNALRVYFYNEACNRVDHVPVSLAENGLAILELHNPGVTANRAGNFLVAGASAGNPGQPRLANHALTGLSYFVDPNQGVSRVEELARLAESGVGWRPYQPSAMLPFAPPDDGGFLTDTLLLRCPVGVTPAVLEFFNLGTPGTLGGDMQDLASQAEGGAPGTVLADDSTVNNRADGDGSFAVNLVALVFDPDGNLLGIPTFPCRCYTEQRLNGILPAAGVTSTHWEIFGLSAQEKRAGLFAGAFSLRAVVGGVTATFAHRLHPAGFL